MAPEEWTHDAIDAAVAALLRVRAQVNEAIEPQRAAGRLGKSLDAAITIAAAPEDSSFRVLEKYRDFLPELFIVSHVELSPAADLPAGAKADAPTSGSAPAKGGGTLHVQVRPCSELGLVRCPRCWRWVPALESSSHAEICPRCVEALKP